MDKDHKQERILRRYFRNLDSEGKEQAFMYAMVHGKAAIEEQAALWNTMYSLVEGTDND